MEIPEPSQGWQQQRHKRILQEDVTAFAELSEYALPHLISFLQQQFPTQEAHQIEITAVDTLMTYLAMPEKYNPDKLSLFAYLRMSARGDMLNAIDKETRHERRHQAIDDPTLQEQIPSLDLLTQTGELDEWLETHTNLTRTELLQKLDDDLDETDKVMLLLMFDGIRDTSRYAEVMGISDLPQAEQQAQVKRAKDRLQKRLQRFGNEIRN